MKRDEEILDEFFKYYEEQNSRDRNYCIPKFSESKTKNGLYHGLNQNELETLLKQLLN